jgi:outer membrane biogenesis lipoprotein LolB
MKDRLMLLALAAALLLPGCTARSDRPAGLYGGFGAGPAFTSGPR